MNKIKNILASVKSNFNTIAPHFAQTREFIWPDIAKFLPKITKKTKILDLGCGSGRMSQITPNKSNYLGIDFAQNLLTIGHKNYQKVKFVLGDITDNKTWTKITQKAKFNLILCIATLHHLPDQSQHQYVVNKVYQNLTKNGYFLVSVWNLWQKKFWWQHLKQFLVKTRSLHDIWIPYKVSNGRGVKKIVSRYHYAFTPWYLEKLLTSSGFKIIKKSTGLKNKNLIFLAQK